MNDLPDIAEPPSTVDGYNRPQPAGFHRLTSAMNAIGTVWIIVLMVLINTDVIGRDVFGAPVRGVTEIVSMSIVGIVFMQLADTLHAGRFTRAEVLLGPLRRSHPRLASSVQGMSHTFGALLLLVLAVASWPLLSESWTTGEYWGAIGDFQALLWPMRAVIVLGSACTALTFAFLAWADFRAALGRPDR